MKDLKNNIEFIKDSEGGEFFIRGSYKGFHATQRVRGNDCENEAQDNIVEEIKSDMLAYEKDREERWGE